MTASKKRPLPSLDPDKPPLDTGPKTSYAGMLKSAPIDWHLRFQMEGQTLSPGATVFGAIFKSSSKASLSNELWSNLHTVTYRKVLGPAPDTCPSFYCDSQCILIAIVHTLAKDTVDDSGPCDLSVLVSKDSPYKGSLEFLHIINELNQQSSTETRLSKELFINQKLTSKLDRQLQDIVVCARYVTTTKRI